MPPSAASSEASAPRRDDDKASEPSREDESSSGAGVDSMCCSAHDGWRDAGLVGLKDLQVAFPEQEISSGLESAEPSRGAQDTPAPSKSPCAFLWIPWGSQRASYSKRAGIRNP